MENKVKIADAKVRTREAQERMTKGQDLIGRVVFTRMLAECPALDAVMKAGYSGL